MYVRNAIDATVCDTGAVDVSTGTECFFQVIDLYPSSGNLSLQFESNSASQSESLRFGGLLDRCIFKPLVALTTNVFNVQRRCTSTVRSSYMM